MDMEGFRLPQYSTCVYRTHYEVIFPVNTMWDPHQRMRMILDFWNTGDGKECVVGTWFGVGIKLPGVITHNSHGTAILRIEGAEVLAHLGHNEGDEVIVGDDRTEHIHLIIEMAHYPLKPSRENADRHMEVQDHINEAFDLYFTKNEGGELFKSSPYNNLYSMLFKDENQDQIAGKDSQIWHYSSKNLYIGHHDRFSKQLEDFKNILLNIVTGLM